MVSESSSDTLGAPARAKGFLPGDDGLWFFICAEITLFGLLFGAFLSARAEAPDVFRDAQSLMVPLFAFLNTTYLLTSSWLVALSVQIAREGRLPAARRCIDGARVLGLLFVATKAFEYWHEIDLGANPGTNPFFMFYFVTTGIHLGHVIGGLGLLTFVKTRLKDSIEQKDRLMWVESGATFWHMVDLLWLIILALFYLLP